MQKTPVRGNRFPYGTFSTLMGYVGDAAPLSLVL